MKVTTCYITGWACILLANGTTNPTFGGLMLVIALINFILHFTIQGDL